MSDRIIRDELLTSERYWAVSNEAKLLYIHLILNVDDTARFSGKNFTLRTSCFPGQAMEAAHMERMLDELQNNDLIRLYVVDGERYVFVPRFKQRLRFINSRFPEPPNEINDLVIKKSDSSQTQDIPKHDSRPPKLREEKRREELLEQPSVAKTKGNRLPKEWKPNDAMLAFCKTCRPDLDPLVVADSFRDYWLSQPGSKGVKLDWDATWRNWVRNQKQSYKLYGFSVDNFMTGAI